MRFSGFALPLIGLFGIIIGGLTSSLAAQEAVNSGYGAVLRALDKLDARVSDLTIGVGEHISTGRIDVTVNDCRYPIGNPAGDAYAYLTIREVGIGEPVFRGWMIASSPALNAMNHPRYDVWVLRCTTS